MIKTIKASKSEKILFIFLICLSIFAFTSFFLLKNKCLFVEKNNLSKLELALRKNLKKRKEFQKKTKKKNK